MLCPASSHSASVTLSRSQDSGFIFGLSWRLFLPFVGRGVELGSTRTCRSDTPGWDKQAAAAGRPPSSSRTGKHAVITPFILQTECREAVSSVRGAAAVECRTPHLRQPEELSLFFLH